MFGKKKKQEKQDWYEYYTNRYQQLLQNQQIFQNTLVSSGNSYNSFPSLLPMAMRISASTLGSGGTEKSKKQQLKEDRINKLRKLDGKKPNVVLPDDVEIPGLVSVQPMSAPTGLLFHLDYKYKGLREERVEKLKKIEELSGSTQNNI